MADNVQLRILAENRQLLEDQVLGATKVLQLVVHLNGAAQHVSKTFQEDAPYLAGAIITMLADMADRLRHDKPINYAMVDALCLELFTINIVSI